MSKFIIFIKYTISNVWHFFLKITFFRMFNFCNFLSTIQLASAWISQDMEGFLDKMDTHLHPNFKFVFSTLHLFPIFSHPRLRTKKKFPLFLLLYKKDHFSSSTAMTLQFASHLKSTIKFTFILHPPPFSSSIRTSDLTQLISADYQVDRVNNHRY